MFQSSGIDIAFHNEKTVNLLGTRGVIIWLLPDEYALPNGSCVQCEEPSASNVVVDRFLGPCHRRPPSGAHVSMASANRLR